MISEIDIRDMQPLYNLPRGSKFKLAEDPHVPIAALQPTKEFNDVYKLDHIDGMYSYCIDILTNEVFHFAAWTNVIKVKEGWDD